MFFFKAPKYKIQKFRDWLMSYVTLELKLSPFVFEVFSYLAYETVAQVGFLSLTNNSIEITYAGFSCSSSIFSLTSSSEIIVLKYSVFVLKFS